MITTIQPSPGVVLRCFTDTRFKQGRLSLQLVRPMCREEAALNALLPMVLLRGTRHHPDLRSITMKLDDLYGATVGDLVRRIGDIQTTGFYCGFTEDRFALENDEILRPVIAFLRELLLEPLLVDGCFCPEFVAGERRSLIADIEARKNDKAAYASGRLMEAMCPGDSFSIPRLGGKEQAAAITPELLYAHYQRILRESPVEIFYVGSARPERVAELVKPIFEGLDRSYVNYPAQTPFHDTGSSHTREEMDITQSRLCMGFVTDVTNQSPGFAAMQVWGALYGAGMTSKLFQNVREKMSLCYSIGSGYYGSKGLITVAAGIDADKEETVRAEVLRQLQCCRDGEITDAELTAAKEAVLSGLRGVVDSPGTIEGYFSTAALSGLRMDLSEYARAVEQVDTAAVAEAARRVRYHSSFFLKGASHHA